MKKITIIFGLIVICSIFLHAQFQFSGNEKTIERNCEIENSVFSGGESIVYKLYYNWNFIWISAGEVEFHVDEYEDYYHLTATGTTYDSYSMVFDVNDKFESFIDKETLLPFRSKRDLKEGDYTLVETVDYDRDNGLIYTSKGTTEDTKKDFVLELEDCAHDVLSVLYHARNVEYQNFNEGDLYPLTVYLDKETYPLGVRYAGKKKKKFKGLGRFDAFQFKPEVIAGDIFTEDSEMSIWMSTDERRIPLMIESPIAVGSIKAILKSYSK